MMTKFRSLKWASLMMAVAVIISSCGGDDEKGIPGPVSKFTFEVDADNFLLVDFTNTTTNGSTYVWDFGDDETSTEKDPSHTYSETGEFTVKLTATNATGTSSSTQKITITAKLTNTVLNGGSSKSWKLKPAAGTFVVSNKNGDRWWPETADENLSISRTCAWNDEFIFKTNNVYEYDANGDVYAEAALMGTEGCLSEGYIPENAKAWGSKTHSYTFTDATASLPHYITVTGTGAFIALNKAYNGETYTAAPPTADASVKYTVESYTSVGSVETLTLTLAIADPGVWKFVLIHDNSPE